MPLYYRLGNPGITSVSIDGQAHEVNADGLLEVHEQHLTPRLVAEITGHFGGRQHQPDNDAAQKQTAAMSDEEVDREMLFARLDTIKGHRTARRRSLAQLQKELGEHEARQARIEGASAALAQTRAESGLAS